MAATEPSTERVLDLRRSAPHGSRTTARPRPGHAQIADRNRPPRPNSPTRSPHYRQPAGPSDHHLVATRSKLALDQVPVPAHVAGSVNQDACSGLVSDSVVQEGIAVARLPSGRV